MRPDPHKQKQSRRYQTKQRQRSQAPDGVDTEDKVERTAGSVPPSLGHLDSAPYRRRPVETNAYRYKDDDDDTGGPASTTVIGAGGPRPVYAKEEAEEEDPLAREAREIEELLAVADRAYENMAPSQYFQSKQQQAWFGRASEDSLLSGPSIPWEADGDAQPGHVRRHPYDEPPADLVAALSLNKTAVGAYLSDTPPALHLNLPDLDMEVTAAETLVTDSPDFGGRWIYNPSNSVPDPSTAWSSASPPRQSIARTITPPLELSEPSPRTEVTQAQPLSPVEPLQKPPAQLPATPVAILPPSQSPAWSPSIADSPPSKAQEEDLESWLDDVLG
ncbi:hypothetical protein IWQ60_001211 [Tieghemiomyces parasiticus]|uniref:Uncharacterized protein n=1 Tax=Tieghemiomyces parasiticus TaxID=78921 RepID=A0A9W8AEN0_9FUNG|nr:hypothetical protein IWQ60_001211 [Tieghemiomyces parasiticus]